MKIYSIVSVAILLSMESCDPNATIPCKISNISYFDQSQGNIVFTYNSNGSLISIDNEEYESYEIQYTKNRIAQVNYNSYLGNYVRYYSHSKNSISVEEMYLNEGQEILERTILLTLNSSGRIIEKTIYDSSGAQESRTEYTWSFGNISHIKYYDEFDDLSTEEMLTYDSKQNPVKNLGLVRFKPELTSQNNITSFEYTGGAQSEFEYFYNSSNSPTNYPLSIIGFFGSNGYGSLTYKNCE
jgi:hypothetical protein